MVNFYCRIHPLFVDFPTGLWRAYAYFISWTEEELCPSLPPPPFIDGTNSYIFFSCLFFLMRGFFLYAKPSQPGEFDSLVNLQPRTGGQRERNSQWDKVAQRAGPNRRASSSGGRDDRDRGGGKSSHF